MTAPVAPSGLTRPRSDVVTLPDGSAALVAEDPGPRDPHHVLPRSGSPTPYLHDVFEQRCDAAPEQLAVDGAEATLTFAELDRSANRLARHLLRRGSRPGDRIALLVDRPTDAYTAMLAVSKIHATFVPLDVGFPGERIAYILGDAGVRTLLTRRSILERVSLPLRDGRRTAEPVCLDEDLGTIGAAAADRVREAELPASRPSPTRRQGDTDPLAYIIYTSGSTGRPKGVAVGHRSIDNFVRVASAAYGMVPGDRVYQGMTIAFDFSVEEIWVPWAAGATLVPKPAGETLLGRELSAHLDRHGVTALCCVPTLLATLDDDLPALRFLLVSGEACPQDLITRWHRPGRRFLNVYGPTEATVTATWTELHPDRAVTIGVPLPTYAVVVLDPDDPTRALPHGETGEIALAGVGLARGYLNNEERTRQSFARDFLGLDALVANPSGRLYRTGDLGRISEHGEVEYQGRIDLQVKIRGYRIELTEIESILLQAPGVAAAVVDTHEPEPGITELVGYYTDRRDGAADPATILAMLRAELPSYMVPAYLERLPAIPLTTSDKVDRANLPAPTARRATPTEAHVEPATDTERRLADALGLALGVERVSVTANVFDDLGVTSLLVARFTAALRTGSTGGSVTLKDVYQHPTVRELASGLDTASPTPTAAAPTAPAVAGPVDGPRRPRRAAHLLTACAQGLLLVGVVGVAALLLQTVFGWLTTAPSLAALAGRGAIVTGGGFAALCLLPIAAKWVLIGRWTAREIPLWSLAHFRFWLVKSLVRLSPLVVFVGTPLYAWHLRALGARVGRDVVLLSRVVPVATDLLSIGDDTVIRAASSFTGYRAEAGRLRVGAVTIGSDALVGERTVLDVDTRVGDGAQLRHGSALHPGAAVPDGSTWHGSPAVPADGDLRDLPGRRTGRLRTIVFGAALLVAVLVPATAVLTLLVWALGRLPGWIAALATGGTPSPRVVGLAAGGVSLAVVLLLLVLRLTAMVVVPRILAPLVRPGATHRLCGVSHLAQLAISATTNAPFLMLLLGDSSFVVGFLRGLGYRLTPVVQTGSNFGTQMRHDAPGLVRVGSGTMVSDGLRVANAHWSSTSFRLDRVAVGERNFLGNDIVFPAGARVGDNCLLATKVLVPTDGPVHRDVGLLGSPAFTIPRSRPRGPASDVLDDPDLVRRGLAAKNRHNALSIVTVLLARALQLVVVLVLAGLAASAHARYGGWAFVVSLVALLLVGLALPPLFERAATGFRRLRPRHCSIYDRGFWRHERLWKFYRTPFLPGSALQGLLLRLAGVRTGRRLFDDGCVVPEKGLVTLGDDVVLNERSVIQCHSLEDGLFTRDRTDIGSGSTLGVGAFVHYGVAVGAGCTVGADSFLMKGEQMAPGTTWAGNPAEPRQGGSW